MKKIIIEGQNKPHLKSHFQTESYPTDVNITKSCCSN